MTVVINRWNGKPSVNPGDLVELGEEKVYQEKWMAKKCRNMFWEEKGSDEWLALLGFRICNGCRWNSYPPGKSKTIGKQLSVEFRDWIQV